MMNTRLLVILSGVLMVAGTAVFALQCHQCSTWTESQCGDPFHYESSLAGEERKPKTLAFLSDCPDDGKNYTVCRKIYQKVHSDVRIIRSCGYEPDERECYKTVLEDYDTYTCQCSGDRCNGAESSSVAFVSVLQILALTLTIPLCLRAMLAGN